MAIAPRLLAPLFIAAAATIGCGDHGAERSVGEPATAIEAYGTCVFCHADVGDQLYFNRGHGGFDVKCEACHADLQPNDPGPGHRAIAVCADCHTMQVTHADAAAGTADECKSCHDPHGSANLVLLRPSIETPGGDTAVLQLTNLGGLRDGGFASVSDPGSGVCETCHTTTRYYRSDGSGEPHFEFPCFTCHPHADSFAP